MSNKADATHQAMNRYDQKALHAEKLAGDAGWIWLMIINF
jgi:hypothetical protein